MHDPLSLAFCDRLQKGVEATLQSPKFRKYTTMCDSVSMQITQCCLGVPHDYAKVGLK